MNKLHTINTLSSEPRTRPLATGQAAPSFRLPTVQGEHVASSQFHQQKNVILWFSRGVTCNFCRNYMESFMAGYETLAANNIELIQVAPNLLDSARRYFDKLPRYPFACDPEKHSYALYGLGDRGVVEATRSMVVSFARAGQEGEFGNNVRGAWLDIANRNFLRRLHHHALTAVEQGVFIIDKNGVIRYSLCVGPIEKVPSSDELLMICRTVCPE